MGDPLFDMLICPSTREPLRQANQQLLQRLNDEVVAGRLKNVAGSQVETPMDDALIADRGRKVFPVYDNIMVLIADEAIELTEELVLDEVIT